MARVSLIHVLVCMLGVHNMAVLLLVCFVFIEEVAQVRLCCLLLCSSGMLLCFMLNSIIYC